MVLDSGIDVLFYNRGWDSKGSQWHKLEDFVSDFYIRRYGLHRFVPSAQRTTEATSLRQMLWFRMSCCLRSDSLAEQHMRTLIRSVAVHHADPNIRMFGYLLDTTYSSNDQAFFLTVRSLCRYGVPRRAWTIAGMPIGGRYDHNRSLTDCML
jgi:hypothetical protein